MEIAHDAPMTSFCVRCKVSREIPPATRTQGTTKNGRPAVYGRCPVCQTKTVRMHATLVPVAGPTA